VCVGGHFASPDGLEAVIMVLTPKICIPVRNFDGCKIIIFGQIPK
jgi:hypothetical protein